MDKIVKWGLLAFVAWWIIHDPGSAGAAVHKIGNLATQAATSLATLVSSI